MRRDSFNYLSTLDQLLEEVMLIVEVLLYHVL